MAMGKRKVKVEDAPQPMSDSDLADLRKLLNAKDRPIVAPITVVEECIVEIERLRAVVAANDVEIARWSKSASLHAEMNAQYGKWFDRIIDAIGCDPDSDSYFGDVTEAIVEWANTGVRPKFVTVSTNIPKRKRKATP
jgi:spore coat polysaccharide biosynthesis predicted glycosyltransferase SpsG